MQEKKWAEAAAVLRGLLQERPDHAQAELALSNSLIYLGRREEAVQILVRSAERQKGEARQRLLKRAQVLSRQFLTDETAQIYQEGVNFIAFDKIADARARFEAALSREPDNVELLLRRAQCDVSAGNFDHAAEDLRVARRMNPEEPEIRLWLGRALHQRGELREAATELEFARKKMPQSDLAVSWLSEAYLSLGRKQQAIELLEADLKKEPFHLLALVTLARIRAPEKSLEFDGLWKARRDLQVALSRFDEYQSFGYFRKFESELGLIPRQPKELKTEIQALLKDIDNRIESPRVPALPPAS